MAAPTVASVGAVAAGTGDITVNPGTTHTANDVDIVLVEKAEAGAATLATANGFAVISALSQDTSAVTSMTVFWRRWNGTDGAPVIEGSGNDHTLGRMISVSGCKTSGDPWNTTATGTTDSTADTSVSIAGGTTSVADCLILAMVCQELPDANSTTEFGSWANADLTAANEEMDNARNAGNGGALAMVSGVKTAAGTFGATTGTATTSARRVCGMLALEPPATAKEVAGSPAGTSTITSNLRQIHRLVSTIAGSSTVTASLYNNPPTLLGALAGASTVVADLRQIHRLVATTTGSATVTANSTQVHRLTATTTGTSTVTADLTVIAWDWNKVMVPPTGSSGLDTGDHTAVDEAAPWSDSDEAVETISSSATEVAIFNGFDLSQAGGEKEGFWIWARMRSGTAAGFLITITLKQDTTTLWTSDPWPITTTVYRTFVIPIPDSTWSGDPDIDNLSLEFSCENQGSNSSVRWSWLRISKSPFTDAEKAELPSSLTGQDFTCYRASDIGTLGGSDGQSLFMLPDSSGKGRHAVLRAGSPTYESNTAPTGILTSGSRFAGCLGFDTATGVVTKWSGNKVMHAAIYPTSLASPAAIFSSANAADFIDVVIPGEKILMAYETDTTWTLMSGDGSAGAHLHGGSVTTDTLQRVTEWIQTSGGNEKFWEEDDASPVIDDTSGDNPFYSWSILDRESDDRPVIGRLAELWFVEGTGVTEAEIDSARDEWVNGAATEVAATIAGTSTVTSNLHQIHRLLAVTAGTSTITSNLIQVHPLLSSITASSTVTTNATQVHRLLATTAGTSTITAVLFSPALAAAIAGTSTVTSNLRQLHPLLASIGGTSTVTADIDAIDTIHATPAGAATVTANLRQTHPLLASVSGGSTLSANATQIHRLLASVTGSSAVTAAVVQMHQLVSSINGSSTVTSNAIQVHRLTTTILGTSTITALLFVQGADPVLLSSIAGLSSVTADLRQVHRLVTSSAGSSTVTADLPVARLLQAASAGLSTITANAVQIHSLRATPVGTSAVTADLLNVGSFSTFPAGTSTVTAALTVITNLLATIAGTSSVGPNLHQLQRLTVVIAGTSQVVASLNVPPTRGRVSSMLSLVGSVSVSNSLVGSLEVSDG